MVGPWDGAGDQPLQLLDARSRTRRDRHGGALVVAQPGEHHGIRDVRLVQGHDLGDVVGPHVRENVPHGLELTLRIRVGGVDHVHDDVRVRDLLERGAERLDELRGKGPHEAHGVRQGVADAVRGLRLAHRGVQGGEQGVLHEHTGVRESVQQGGLPGVGVARDRHGGHRVALAVQPLGLPGGLHGRDLPAQLGHPLTDATAVQLDLGLTGSTAADALARRRPAAGLAGQGLAPAAQSREHVLQLGELHLGLALLGLRVLREDVQDQTGAVDDLDLDHVLERAPL